MPENAGREVTVEELNQGLSLAVDGKHRLVLVTEKSPGHPIPAACFAFDSAFPGPGIFEEIKRVKKIAADKAGARLVAFGHTDPKGSAGYNKNLSDRRAKAVLALLKRDLPLFDQVAEAEAWELKQYQAMLRGLGCNPGAIDGINGPLTKDAVWEFQTEYNDDVYHSKNASRAYGDLVVDGILGSKTEAALRDAYLACCPGETVKNPNAKQGFAGCSEFNPISGKDSENRRVVVAFFPGDKPADNRFPCTEGDAKACPLDAGQKLRCKFYRLYVNEIVEPPIGPWFFDFQWLREKDGVAHLSALTPLADDTPAKFTVYRCEEKITLPPPSSWAGGSPPVKAKELGTVQGKIVGGVCYARWKPANDYDPFSFEDWLVDNDFEIEIFEDEDEGEPAEGDPASSERLFREPGIHPPIFKIEAEGHWAYSPPPGKRLNRIYFSNEPNAVGCALCNDGTAISFSASSGKVEEDDNVEILALTIESKDAEFESELESE